ncbi:L-lactate dehydrogenase complex protein LldG [Caldalkalibacillus uzonensis]|uniref:L-lactate dehydrogenase complex protein LldG n=1 Tax=Caldalkalibacillus uzonensis TaxID=353224 RepID=A0ABU0CUP0_9BACI|nr:lactate utilization protein C [Caldalkalibacillus uzonensis]MDQ0340049.1 L-lactate dehydrogenase complex protein LldG [Caldalkalibacillus uzonensis]
MADRQAFLQKIAHKLGRPTPTQVNRPRWTRHPWDHLCQGLTQSELVDQFEQELSALTGEVVRISTLQELPEAVSRWIQEEGCKRIVAWQHPSAAGQVLTETLNQLRDIHTTYWSSSAGREALIAAAEQADLGLVVAEHGLAETGTVVLYNRGEQGRLVSLLPTTCGVILHGSQIIPRLTQVLSQFKGIVPDYSCINLITGPSRSADIEMDLSIGVHGPGRIVVFLIDDHLS